MIGPLVCRKPAGNATLDIPNLSQFKVLTNSKGYHQYVCMCSASQKFFWCSHLEELIFKDTFSEFPKKSIPTKFILPVFKEPRCLVAIEFAPVDNNLVNAILALRPDLRPSVGYLDSSCEGFRSLRSMVIEFLRAAKWTYQDQLMCTSFVHNNSTTGKVSSQLDLTSVCDLLEIKMCRPCLNMTLIEDEDMFCFE